MIPVDLSVLQGAIVALVGIGGGLGAYLAGRRSYNKQVALQAQQVSDGWKNLYDVAKAKNEQLEAQINQLRREGHEKDLAIASLGAKVDTLFDIFKSALDKEVLAKHVGEMKPTSQSKTLELTVST